MIQTLGAGVPVDPSTGRSTPVGASGRPANRITLQLQREGPVDVGVAPELEAVDVHGVQVTYLAVPTDVGTCFRSRLRHSRNSLIVETPIRTRYSHRSVASRRITNTLT